MFSMLVILHICQFDQPSGTSGIEATRAGSGNTNQSFLSLVLVSLCILRKSLYHTPSRAHKFFFSGIASIRERSLFHSNGGTHPLTMQLRCDTKKARAIEMLSFRDRPCPAGKDHQASTGEPDKKPVAVNLNEQSCQSIKKPGCIKPGPLRKCTADVVGCCSPLSKCELTHILAFSKAPTSPSRFHSHALRKVLSAL